MRYGIISDIHGNLEAFRAVVDAMSREVLDEYYCAGDVVGYGADPCACIAGLKLLNPRAVVAGNHDLGVLDLLSLEYFNEEAAAAVVWTKGVLNKTEFKYLESFRISCEHEKFTIVHGSLNEPAKFHYILDRSDAYHTLKLMKRPLCFVGHSHASGIFYLVKDKVFYTKEPKVEIGRDKKYVVNTGSVGQPRDGDPRASYAVYDDKTGTIEIKRVEYDIKTAQAKILRARLPEWLASRLEKGR